MTLPTLCYLTEIPTPTGVVQQTLCGHPWQSRPHTSAPGSATCPDCLRVGAGLVVHFRERVAKLIPQRIDWTHNGGPPWTFQTKPPGYEPPCGHRHGLFRCTDSRCGYGLTPGGQWGM